MPNPLTALLHQLQTGDVVLVLALVLLMSWCCYRLLQWAGLTRSTVRRERFARFASEIGLLLALEQAYEFTRGEIPRRTDVALLHAYNLFDLELKHGFFIESRVERFFLQFPSMMDAIDLFYILGHFVVTVGVLAWIFSRRAETYPFVRNLLVITTAIALVAFYVYPTAPPRMFGIYGFVDPLQLHHLVSDGGAQPNSYTYNPYAAMPSLHVVYALVIGWALFLANHRLWIRALAVAYPLMMAAAVIISGNHWILDVVGAFITVAISAGLILAARRLQTLVLPNLGRPLESPS